MLEEVLKATKSRILRSDIIFSKDFIFPTVITEWNNIDINILNSSSINVIKQVANKCNRVKGHGKLYANDVIKK